MACGRGHVDAEGKAGEGAAGHVRAGAWGEGEGGGGVRARRACTALSAFKERGQADMSNARLEWACQGARGARGRERQGAQGERSAQRAV